MAGILQFVLGMESSKYRQAVRGAADETNKFIKVSELAAKATLVFYKSTAEMKKSMNLDTPGVEKHTGSLRHMRHELNLVSEAASMMGGELGQLGTLAGLAFNPWLVAIAAVVMSMDALWMRWQTRMAEMSRVIQAMQNLRVARLEAGITAQNDAARSNVEFYLSLLHSADGIDRESQAMERRIALFGATVAAQNEVFDAQTRATEATIATAEAMGQLNPLQAEANRQYAEAAEWEQQHESDLAQRRQEINERQARLDEAPGRLAAAERDHDAAVAAAEHPRQVLLAEQARVEDLRSNLQRQTEGAANSTAFARAVSGVANSVGGNWGGIVRWAGSQRFDVANIDRAQLQQARELLLAGEQRVAGLERQQLILDRTVGATQDRATIEMGILNTYPQQIQQSRSLLAIRQQEYHDEAHARAEGMVAAMDRPRAEARAGVVRDFRRVTDPERMGFHFRSGGGGPTSISDHAWQSLQQQHRAANLLNNIYGLLLRGQSGLPSLRSLLTNQMP